MRDLKAIVYQSNAGHTRRYAELFAKLSELPVYELKEARAQIRQHDEIIFFGWLCAGSVPGYAKSARKYQVCALCVVGMGRPEDQQIIDVAKKYHVTLDNTFYLQGGFDFHKLHGIYKYMMKIACGFSGI